MEKNSPNLFGDITGNNNEELSVPTETPANPITWQEILNNINISSSSEDEELEEKSAEIFDDDNGEMVSDAEELSSELSMSEEIQMMDLDDNSDEYNEDGYSDEFDANNVFDDSNYEKEFQAMMEKTNALSQWLYLQLVKFEKGESLDSVEYRFEHIYKSWINYLIVNDAMMRETTNLSTYVDRTTLVSHGSLIFANIFQLHVLKTIKLMKEARKTLANRFIDKTGVNETYNEKSVDNDNDKYDYSSIQDETEGIRLSKFRISHLGLRHAKWETKLNEEEYERDQKFQRMSKEEWFDYVKQKEGEDAWKSRKKPPLPYKAKEQVRLPNHKTIIQFRQSEIIRALKLMTRYLNESPPTPAMKDFFQVLMWRNGLFFCKDHDKNVLDSHKFRTARIDEDGTEIYIFNRTYLFFSYFYCWSIMKRWYFYDMYCGEEHEFVPRFRFNKRLEQSDIKWLLANQCKRTDERFIARSLYTDTNGASEEDIVTVKNWIQNTLFPSLGVEGFNMLYEQTMEEAYRFPGDLNFFKIIEPRRPTNTASVLAFVRQEDDDVRDSFGEEMKITMANIVRAVGTTYANDNFVLNAIDAYVRSYVSNEIMWRDSFVIEADWMEHAGYALSNFHLPMIVQLFNAYWIIFETRVYRTKNTLETLTLWFKIMDRWFEGALEWEIKPRGEYVTTTSLKELLDQIWRPPLKYKDLGNGIHDKPLF